MLWHNLVLSPPVDLVHVSRELGVRVVETDLGWEIAGLYMLSRAGQPVIGLNSRDYPQRRRFTWAHELGHHLMHTSISVLMLEDHRDRSPEERRCSRFAAELLMPRALIRQLVTTFPAHPLRRIQMVSEVFDVSRWASRRRLGELHLL